MAFSEDLTQFINPGTPGYVRATVGGTDMDALFDHAAALDFNISGQSAVLHCFSALVDNLPRGTAVIVKNINYKIKNSDPDGTGITVLGLDKV